MSKLHRRSIGVASVLLLVLALTTTAAFAGGRVFTYEVTVTNLTEGQPFTPPLAATHRAQTALFHVGAPASVGIQQIAENGNLDPALAALMGDKHVYATVVALAAFPPVLPGESRTFQITADNSAKWLSFAAMLICTNDGFTGVDALRLPARTGESVMAYTDAYDAGTEINTEDFADLVPPCPALTGVPSGVPGTGMSNPALAEGGVIMHHMGIAGSADLLPALHGWTDPVGMITVTRVD